MDSAPRSPNGFLSALSADDFELVRPHLRMADLVQDFALVEVGESLKRAYLPHRSRARSSQRDRRASTECDALHAADCWANASTA